MYYKVTSELYRKDFPTFQHQALVNSFVHAIHCRLPYELSFLTGNVVSIVFSVGGHSYLLNMEISEFEKVMSYALMHIDDVL